MTRTTLCERIILNFAKQHRVKPEDISAKHMHLSSSLAVALEYLGALSPNEKEYSQCRGGNVEYLIFCGIITKEESNGFTITRDLLESLPD